MHDTGRMVTEDQSEVVAFLDRPDTYGPDCAGVERIDTHSAMVFLAGPRALKMKRAVHYDYLDFSTVANRRRFCDLEVLLNRRTAPQIYRRVAAVTREPDGRLALDGTGRPVEWLVDMLRFDDGALCDRLAAKGRLPLEAMPALAEAISHLHEVAARRPDQGGSAGMRWVVEGNQAAFDAFGDDIFASDTRVCLAGALARVLAHATPLLDLRQSRGLVRQCHGDLHLRNIVLLDGEPILFDAIEFNDAIACGDVFYDLAFVLMDLWRRGLTSHANLLLNEYVRHTEDREGLALLPLFLSCRAAVRAKTNATAATLAAEPDAVRRLVDDARAYMDLAVRFLESAPATLVAIGGVSGTGKSTVAARIAPLVGAAPGALHLRTDVIRKQGAGVNLSARLATDAYRPTARARVYAEMRHQASDALAAGHAVVCDAVFASRAEREAMGGVAAGAHVPFVGVWLEAPEATLLSRVSGRSSDPSDATEKVVRAQLAGGANAPEWEQVDADGDGDHTHDLLRRRLSAHGVVTSTNAVPAKDD